MRTPSSAAILLSRQPLRPTRDTPWVQATGRAVRHLGSQGSRLYTSIGLGTWEMLLTLAAREAVDQTIVVPARHREEFSRKIAWVLREFDLAPELVEFVGVLPESPADSTKALMQLRDRYIVSKAHRLVPVSIRAGGAMTRAVREAEEVGAPIDRQFEVRYQNRRDSLAYELPCERLSGRIREIGDRYIVHWTRASHGPWPTERAVDFYTAILTSPRYPRAGIHSLCNILETGRIVGSSRHMPGRVPTVSFSGVSPVAMIPLMRWRTRYAEMSFEPYGIGIERTFASSYGIRPVSYHNGKGEGEAESSWLRQSEGTKGNWRAEDEWRCKGDLELSEIPREKLVVFCRTPAEARELSRRYGLAAVPFLQCPQQLPN